LVEFSSVACFVMRIFMHPSVWLQYRVIYKHVLTGLSAVGIISPTIFRSSVFR